MIKTLIPAIFALVLLCSHSLYASVSDSTYSTILKEDRPLVIQLPKSYYDKPKSHYGVLYLLDGQRNIDHTAGTLDILHQSDAAPELIIVGINNTDRSRDLTPTINEDTRGGPLGSGGGGDQFLDFIETELIPYINKKYRTRDFKILAGHSAGGLLAIHSLQSRPQLFQAHFAFSPSVWWSVRKTIKRTLAFMAKTPQLNNNLYMNIGSEGGEMRDVYDGLVNGLQQNMPAGFAFKSQAFDNVPHNLTAAAGQFAAFRHLFLPIDMPAIKAQKGLGAIKQYYQAVSAQYGYTILPSEGVINNTGYFFLMNKKEIKTAIQLFEFNSQNYSDSANTHDSLAEAYEQDGQINKAIEQVDLALKLYQSGGHHHVRLTAFREKLLESKHQ